jgi:flagellum-specific peptidoglycan hydrolase FlgJ
MLHSKIPASITLAQGILESGAGQSELARLANNHFGIKCGGNWSGMTYYKIYSETASDENHDFSCYRSYPTADASFTNHSDFIAGPRLGRRYESLFLLKPTDTKAGLMVCCATATLNPRITPSG